VAFMISLE